MLSCLFRLKVYLYINIFGRNQLTNQFLGSSINPEEETYEPNDFNWACPDFYYNVLEVSESFDGYSDIKSESKNRKEWKSFFVRLCTNKRPEGPEG